MKAVVVGRTGLEIREISKPDIGHEDVLVRVVAAALNRTDVMMSEGHMHGKLGGHGTVLGAEWAGEVVSTGDCVSNVKIGDRVMCTGVGAFAEYAVADMGRVHRLTNADMTYSQAASLPVALQTMHNAIVTVGALKAGKTILVQGASMGVGLVGLQIAKLLGASLVIGSSTSSEKRRRILEFGADLAIDSRHDGWVKQVLQATSGEGVDLVVDQISGGVANGNLAATAIKGRIVNVGRLGGFGGDFNYDLHAERQIEYIGVTFRTRTVQEIRTINKLMWNDLGSHVEFGNITVPVEHMFRLRDISEAFSLMKSNAHFGKIVVDFT